MTQKKLTILAVGDLVLETPKAEYYLSLAIHTLKSPDLLIGQGEVVFTERGTNTFVDIIPAPGCPTNNIHALASAGFQVITLAGNHIWDSGSPGIEDTINGLHACEIDTVGAGMNLEEARTPVIIKRDGTQFGFLSYNCVGPRGSWARPDKPGCAYVQIISHYEMELANPGGTPTVYTFLEPGSLALMIDDIQKLRKQCDVLVVALHKGIVRVRSKLAMYERPVSYAAIDAGADLVLGNHAHILKGIELYKGKAIFHGLNHFVMDTKALTDEQKKSRELFGIKSRSSDLPNPQENESNLTIIAKCIIDKGKITRVSFLPCLINNNKQPEVLGNNEMGMKVFNYMDQITREAGLNTKYRWDGNEIVVYAD